MNLSLSSSTLSIGTYLLLVYLVLRNIFRQVLTNEEVIVELVLSWYADSNTKKEKTHWYIKVWFGFFVNGISTLYRLFNAKAILLEEQ